ncbi:NAD(P)H-hydrate epimerase, partial [Candidatus Bathyarchaeota archaeon]|nr:NAD(P)H-hydrate epimerase [Candidatus Bathyarchaeota archaeon]
MPRSGETEERISSKEMQTLEVNAEYFGISQLQLMENAGRSIAHEISLHVSTGKKVILFCGLGGNGGDGFVAARHLSSMGYKTKVVLAGQGKAIKHEAALRNWKALQFLKESIVVVEVKDSSSVPKTDADVIVDALLGIGTKGKLRSPTRQIVECINNSQALKIAVDVPTGLDSDTGKVSSVAVKADITITF